MEREKSILSVPVTPVEIVARFGYPRPSIFKPRNRYVPKLSL